MPRELNVEKLERKFTSLTKSRESIQAVSSWIMHHHEFCEEIVEQWYIALSKDQNALMMFFVANEVIQNCGKKRVPQYREAFSKVLEKAVCLEKVKEIKADVHRIFNLWKERSIFDYDFFQKLEANLNESIVTSSPSTEEDEVSEMEIITKYKSRNLFDSLRRLKVTEAEAKEKENILNFSDAPVIPEFDHLPAHEECLEILKKIHSFQKGIEECLTATNKEIETRKNALKELKHSCIFYTAQYGDVKKVANAYMTYGKRLKNMIKKLSEKILVLPSPVPVEKSSPCFSESNTCSSSTISTPVFDHDTMSNKTFSKISPGSSNEEGQDITPNSDNFKNSFFNKISKNASVDVPTNFEKKLEETMQKRLEQSSKQKFSKLAELFADTKSDSGKHARPEPVLTETSNLKCLSSPNEQNEDYADLQIAGDQQMPKNTEFNSADKSSNQETGISNNLTRETLNEKEKTVSAENDNEIDLLLEKSYDSKKAKSSINFKRKIELLLQSQGKKICKDASKGQNSGCILPSNNVEEKKSFEDIMEDSTKLSNPDNISINQDEGNVCASSKMIVPVLSPSFKRVEKTLNTISNLANAKSGVEKNLSVYEKIQNVSNIVVPSSDTIEKSKEIDFLNDRSEDSFSNNNETSKADNTRNNSNTILEFNFNSQNSKESSNDNFSLQTPSTFFDSSLFSSISSISDEFLKNILAKNKSSPCHNAEDSYATYTSSINDFIGTKKLQENEDSENTLKTPTLNFLLNVPTTEEVLMPTNIMSKSLSHIESTNDKAVKNLSNIKDSSNSNNALDNISIKYKDSEQPNVSEQEIRFFDTKLIKLGDNDKKMNLPTSDVQLKSKDKLETEKAEDKPNLLLTLQNIIECISNKSLFLSDSKNVSEATPVTFENCLSMYHALKSSDSENASNSSPSSQDVVVSKAMQESTFSSEIYCRDNLEVMDMDCDSD